MSYTNLTRYMGIYKKQYIYIGDFCGGETARGGRGGSRLGHGRQGVASVCGDQPWLRLENNGRLESYCAYLVEMLAAYLRETSGWYELGVNGNGGKVVGHCPLVGRSKDATGFASGDPAWTWPSHHMVRILRFYREISSLPLAIHLFLFFHNTISHPNQIWFVLCCFSQKLSIAFKQFWFI